MQVKTAPDVQQLMLSVTLTLGVCVLVNIRAESDSLRRIYCVNMNESLTRSIFEEPCVSVEGKKTEEEKTFSRCLTG